MQEVSDKQPPLMVKLHVLHRFILRLHELCDQ